MRIEERAKVSIIIHRLGLIFVLHEGRFHCSRKSSEELMKSKPNLFDLFPFEVVERLVLVIDTSLPQ